MELLVTVILGAFIGWIASIIMKTDAEQGMLLNVVVGVVGAFLGGLISRLVTGADRSTVSAFSVEGLLWALLGAVALLAVVNLVRRGSPR